MREHYEILLQDGIAQQMAEKMAKYGEMVVKANEKFNLTRITSPQDMAESHFIDSIDAARRGYIPKDAHLVDIGTGAGFPGVPLAIFLPKAHVTMIDSSEKKIHFIRETCSALKISVTTVCGRSEELAREKQFFQTFDVAVARAVARLNILLELCVPYVRVGGLFLAYKGNSATEEAEEARGAAEKLGMELISISSAGPKNTNHALVIYQRVQDTPCIFPRKYAKIKKSPLS